MCGGLGVLTLIKQAIIGSKSGIKIDFTLRSVCQSSIHKFDLKERVVSFDSKLSFIVREILHLKKCYVKK